MISNLGFLRAAVKRLHDFENASVAEITLEAQR